jgi:hypothetical protein
VHSLYTIRQCSLLRHARPIGVGRRKKAVGMLVLLASDLCLQAHARMQQVRFPSPQLQEPLANLECTAACSAHASRAHAWELQVYPFAAQAPAPERE